MVNHKTSRNACIATAIGLVALLATAPVAAADDPEINDDGSVEYDCVYVNPWSQPLPTWSISVLDCLPPA